MSDKFTNLDELEDRIDRIKLQWDSRKHVGENPAIDVHLESAKIILEDVRKDFKNLGESRTYTTNMTIPIPRCCYQDDQLITAYRIDNENQRKKIEMLDAYNTGLKMEIDRYKKHAENSGLEICRLKTMIDIMQKAFDNLEKEISNAHIR